VFKMEKKRRGRGEGEGEAGKAGVGVRDICNNRRKVTKGDVEIVEARGNIVFFSYFFLFLLKERKRKEKA